MKINTKYIVLHNPTVIQTLRSQLNNHGLVLLASFTGISGSGESILAHAVENKLYSRGGRI